MTIPISLLVTVGYFIGLQAHQMLMRRLVEKINSALAEGQTIITVEVPCGTYLAKLGRRAVRTALDSEKNKFAVISFEESAQSYKALIWPLPSLFSYLRYLKM